MSYLIDDLLNSPFIPERVKTYLSKCTALHVQPVADYYYEIPKSYWELNTDFPNIAPPMPYMWMEWKEPAEINLDGKMKINDLPGTTLGAMIQAIDMKNTPDIDAAIKATLLSGVTSFEQRLRHDFEVLAKTSRWILNMCMFARDAKSKALVPLYAYTFSVTPEGMAEKVGDGWFLMCALTREGNVAIQQHRTAAQLLIHVPMLSLSFMHCKNVTTELYRDSPDRLNRRRAKEGRLPLRKIYTLKIDPMRKVLREHDPSGAAASIKALHICRGHFKDFRDGRGLFGKYHGMYWWPMAARGNRQAGEVAKDYEIALKHYE